MHGVRRSLNGVRCSAFCSDLFSCSVNAVQCSAFSVPCSGCSVFGVLIGAVSCMLLCSVLCSNIAFCSAFRSASRVLFIVVSSFVQRYDRPGVFWTFWLAFAFAKIAFFCEACFVRRFVRQGMFCSALCSDMLNIWICDVCFVRACVSSLCFVRVRRSVNGVGNGVFFL